MSTSKYADLPDIDTAPDVYETEDTIPLSQTARADSSDDESGYQTRPGKAKVEVSGKEELDYSNLVGAEEASKKFRRAEQNVVLRTRTHYAYPPSPTSPSSPLEPSDVTRPVPLSHRLRALQNELSALENELADPSNPLLQKEREEDNVDPGELIRGLVDVRTRLDKIRKGKEGRARLVETLLEEDASQKGIETDKSIQAIHITPEVKSSSKSEVQNLVELDRRLGELEHLVGSSTTTLDEMSPIPTPLLPLVTRLSNQLTILTQPRHIDSISRRLKLLLSDLDRTSAAQSQAHKRHPSQVNGTSQTPSVQEQLFPILLRLGPLLPHIPHILTRLRTLSTLHSSATAFQSTLEDLEEEQNKLRSGLLELEKAVETVEMNLKDNREVVKNNVAGLEGRVNSLLGRLEDLGRKPAS
ncbi:Dynamitin-domain-containing protein [Gymnopilus junonius]|uniref:Dynamitin-domain-containing protein n=1 Tax=Gymnopilus junonius TaxID=109634 RepID=A0A9P5NLZ8_GYMJU|nr:Dynamitin-domain-containing protein [Gymnopilus junonius]